MSRTTSRLREALFETRADPTVFTDSMQNRTLSNLRQSESVTEQRPSRFSEARRRTWHPQNVGSIFLFVFLSSFNVRTTQLKHCHMVRLISLQGWPRTSATSFLSLRCRNLSLTFPQLMLFLDSDGKKINNSTGFCRATLWKIKRLLFQADIFKQSLFLAFAWVPTQHCCSKIQTH